METKKIRILGCGIGGLAAANILVDKLKGRSEVMVIDRKRYFQFPPSYPWLMVGKRKPDQVQKDMKIIYTGLDNIRK